MEKLTKQEAAEALKKLFGYEENRESRNVIVSGASDGSTTFMVNKQYLEREEVIGRLQDFFADKCIEKGQCRVEGVTFVWTTFVIEDM